MRHFLWLFIAIGVGCVSNAKKSDLEITGFVLCGPNLAAHAAVKAKIELRCEGRQIRSTTSVGDGNYQLFGPENLKSCELRSEAQCGTKYRTATLALPSPLIQNLRDQNLFLQ